MMQQYDTDGEYIGRTDSISTCPYCDESWFDHPDNEPPVFDSIVSPTEYMSTLLAQMVWRIKCWHCGEMWLQVMQLSRLFKND